MIYCMLDGGLGNQLFQFGAALRLAKGDISDIRFINAKLAKVGFRLPDLISNHLLPSIATNEELDQFNKNTNKRAIKEEKNQEFLELSILDFEYKKICTDVLLDGYFQSSKNALALRSYLSNNKENNKLFDLAEKPAQADIFVHYRMGDYKRPDVQKVIGIINPAYLDRAISLAMQDNYDRKVGIVTDDDTIANIYGNRKNFAYLIGGNDIQTFKLLMNAKTMIIPNSTFSLLAAYLSPHIKTLYRPLYWTRNVLNDNLTDNIDHCEVVTLPNSFVMVY
jgi:hypothetical protein